MSAETKTCEVCGRPNWRGESIDLKGGKRDADFCWIAWWSDGASKPSTNDLEHFRIGYERERAARVAAEQRRESMRSEVERLEGVVSRDVVATQGLRTELAAATARAEQRAVCARGPKACDMEIERLQAERDVWRNATKSADKEIERLNALLETARTERQIDQAAREETSKEIIAARIWRADLEAEASAGRPSAEEIAIGIGECSHCAPLTPGHEMIATITRERQISALQVRTLREAMEGVLALAGGGNCDGNPPHEVYDDTSLMPMVCCCKDERVIAEARKALAAVPAPDAIDKVIEALRCIADLRRSSPRVEELAREALRLLGVQI